MDFKEWRKYHSDGYYTSRGGSEAQQEDRDFRHWVEDERANNFG